MIDPFPLLMAGHALGDWIVQTDRQTPIDDSQRAAISRLR